MTPKRTVLRLHLQRDTSLFMTKSSADLRSPLIARRMERVSSFLAMDVLSAAAAKERRGDTVIHMEVGG